MRRNSKAASAADEKSGWYADPAMNGEDEAWNTGRGQSCRALFLAFPRTDTSSPVSAADSPMRLDQLGAAGVAGSGAGPAGAGAAAFARPQASGFQSGLASSRASYNTLELASENPMSHPNSGYYDHEVSRA